MPRYESRAATPKIAMIDPGEALCGLFLADARYFSVGTVDTEQMLDYAARRGMEPETLKRLIPNNL